MESSMMIPGGGSVPMVFSSDPAAVAAAETAKARIQMAYLLAMQKPRNAEQSRIKIIESCKRPEFAERVEFRKPQGRKMNAQTGSWENNYIEGPSVRFAEEAIRQWGNVLVETQLVYEDEKIRRSRVTALDLESNSTYTKEIQVTKTVERSSKKGRDEDVVAERVNSYGKTVYILKATDDELHQKEAALISKAVRNEGLRLIPADIVDEAITQARATLLNRDAEDPRAAVKRITSSFAGIGVYPKDLEKYLSQPLDNLSPHQIQDLRGLYQSIKDGEVSWADVMKSTSVPIDQMPADDRLSELQQKASDARAAKKDRQVAADDAGGSGPSNTGPTSTCEDDAGPQAQSELPADKTRPDDWELLVGNDLSLAVGKILPEGDEARKKLWQALVRAKDEAGLRDLARKIVADKTAGTGAGEVTS